MQPDDDDLMFRDEDATDSQTPVQAPSNPWGILVVDDDREVHVATRLVLEGFLVEGRPLSLASAYSGAEAIELLALPKAQLPDLVLLDVVMQTETDGIDTAHAIRNQLALMDIPVIYIRTGQPGTRVNMKELQTNPDVDRVLLKSELNYQSLRKHVADGLLLSRTGRLKRNS